eukprot:6747301-Prymnesium_polylepis.2
MDAAISFRPNSTGRATASAHDSPVSTCGKRRGRACEGQAVARRGAGCQDTPGEGVAAGGVRVRQQRVERQTKERSARRRRRVTLRGVCGCGDGGRPARRGRAGVPGRA